ncbi:MAG: hypothetical protein J7K72_01885 [Candidatus Aenigmarchaeota archaeon]|nr:hypothetical protein [Candidatus Aenigmarchaeota archaeon]
MKSSSYANVKPLIISLFLIIMSSYFVSAAGNLDCFFNQTCSYTPVIYVKNDTGGYWNAHAQNVSVGTYPYVLCCDSNSTLSNVCGEGVFLRLNATTNSHVQRGDYSGPGIIYGIDVCISADPGYFNCTYVDDSCPSDRECLASMASAYPSENNDTNAHIGPCIEYKRKICCRVISEPTVSYEDPTPGNNTRQTGNSATINVSVSGYVDIDTCILEWKEGTNPKQNETMEKIGSGVNVTCNITKTTLDGTNYTFNVYVNDTAGNLAQAGERQFRENAKPDKVILSSPPDGNHTTDRTPTFEWNIPNDADSDTLNYTLKIDCIYEYGDCTDDDRTITDITTNSYTLTQELKYFGDDGYYYNWSVRAGDGYEFGEWSDERNLTIDASASIKLVNATVDFGENRIPGYEDDTTDNDPNPFVLENDGNCVVNVNLSASDLLWDAVSGASDYFKYKVDWYSQEMDSFNYSGSQTAWDQISTQTKKIIDRLNYTDTNDTAETDIYILVPPGEPPGSKSANIVFTGWYVGG